MHFTNLAAVTAAVLIPPSLALPSYAEDVIEKRYDGFTDDLSVRLQSYTPPGKDDSRGPCPALNTLANHGLINHNGKNITSTSIQAAFPRGFGINADGFADALTNFGIVCEYIKGSTCQQADGTLLLTNLTILGEPHAFEHDNSYSRQDYHAKFAHGGITDNIYFNKTEFQTSLDVVGYEPSNPPKAATANFTDFNEIRLQRESIRKSADQPGSYIPNFNTTLFETGFIFGATFNRNSTGHMIPKNGEPVVRLDWWNFWFSEESFPTQLGWVPASTEVFDKVFITSVSKQILMQPVSSTPTNLPNGALATKQPGASTLPRIDPSPVVPLFQSAPYVAPTPPSAIKSEKATPTPAPNKREAAPAPFITLPGPIGSIIASEITAAPTLVASALELVGPAPVPFNMYEQVINVDQLQQQIARAQSFEAAVVSKITSLAGL